MLNYEVDRGLLAPLIPQGTELDFFNGRTFVSVIGFRFTRTRVFGCSFPWHRDFDEVNLRFYVRRKAEGGWRRGVVFIRELVPRRVIAFVARTLYGEPYSAYPMRHRLEVADSGIQVEYAWRRNGRWESLRGIGTGKPKEIAVGSQEEFITEHYWGYTARKAGCFKFQVEHERWRAWHGVKAELDADIASLYGDRFVATLSTSPTSAFIADGSPVMVRGPAN
jgi:hypothetical protein